MANIFATLTTSDVQALLAGCNGKAWQDILVAVRDCDVDGRSLSEHMGSPASLAEFFRENLDCAMNAFVANQFHQKLLAAAAAAGGGGGGGGSGGGGGGGGGGAEPPVPGGGAAMVPLRVQFSRAGGGNMKITVEVPVAATPAVARRCLMDRLGLPLSATLVLSHAGRPLQDTNAAGGPIVDWASLSVVHAVQLPVDTPLTLSNADTHAAVA